MRLVRNFRKSSVPIGKKMPHLRKGKATEYLAWPISLLLIAGRSWSIQYRFHYIRMNILFSVKDTEIFLTPMKQPEGQYFYCIQYNNHNIYNSISVIERWSIHRIRQVVIIKWVLCQIFIKTIYTRICTWNASLLMICQHNNILPSQQMI